MGGWVKRRVGLLRLPALDHSDHFLVAGVLEFSDTIGGVLVSLLGRFERSETLNIYRMALSALEDRLQLVEDDLRLVARLPGCQIPAYDFRAPIPVPFSDAD